MFYLRKYLKLSLQNKIDMSINNKLSIPPGCFELAQLEDFLGFFFGFYLVGFFKLLTQICHAAWFLQFLEYGRIFTKKIGHQLITFCSEMLFFFCFVTKKQHLYFSFLFSFFFFIIFFFCKLPKSQLKKKKQILILIYLH